ncbi:uncharacterized protein KY384_005155 [Bacidia gigantensis]|uniref:uncharacterized protein n=1 Tax=Bacidia gigantensis TaxID=2732470 RepID=UPI001D042D9E|nr:uncharacterized protein KY384_005155 [Bacidia gigantensis]KAG8529674.1 hypothetical protein KY384_005155 [Bacidia gigantensis]
MARTSRISLNGTPNGLNGHAHEVKEHGGHPNGAANGTFESSYTGSTDLERWRLLDERGRQTWHYLHSAEDVKRWPQTVADRYHLGLPLHLPTLPRATTPHTSAQNGLSFFSKLQLGPGNWACEYGGPMFLLPGLVIAWHVTETPIPLPVRIEIKRYLFARQNAEDGGWGLHIEGESTAYGTSMTYVILRLLGATEEDPKMIKARAMLHKLGGAIYAPHWAKFWLSVLGVMEWEAVNPIPPELWLLPDWAPIAPWRWWIHMRQVFLPMSFVYSKRFVYPQSPLILQLRKELYTQSYQTIDFPSHRNSISPRDDYHPKSLLLRILFWVLATIWFPLLRPNWLKRRAEAWTRDLIRREDENTDYADLAPVSAPMNTLACFIQDGPNSDTFEKHIDRLRNYLWMKNEGMLCNGTDGVQSWDTSFAIQAVYEAGLAEDPKWIRMLQKALEFLDDQQIRHNCLDEDVRYRQRRKGAWAFSTRKQGYTVSDTTSEALKAVMMLQNLPSYPTLISEDRLKDAIDTLLTMQNPSGGFASYEPQRASELTECLNAAEVFGRIMVEYDYPECSTAVVTALRLFSEHHPTYRRHEIDSALQGAVRYIRKAQRADGSWYGSWGICFTYAGMFALESLASLGETYENSINAKKGCDFLLSKQQEDGGWGESYRSCETGVYTHRESQVVMTSWAAIGLMNAEYPDREPIKKAIQLIMTRQQANGEWLQEGIEGVFNKSVWTLQANVLIKAKTWSQTSEQGYSGLKMLWLAFSYTLFNMIHTPRVAKTPIASRSRSTMLIPYGLLIPLWACIQLSSSLPLTQTFTNDTTSRHVASLLNAKPFFSSSLGSLQAITAKELPILDTLSVQRIVLEPGAIREPHWYTNCNEVAYAITGKLLVTIFGNVDTFSSFTIDAGQMFYTESGYLQAIENVGDETAVIITSPRSSLPVDISLSATFGSQTDAVLGNTYNDTSSFWSPIARTSAPNWIVKRNGPPSIPSTAGLPDPRKFDIEAQRAPIDFPYGTAKLARSQYWPALEDLAFYSLRVTDEGMREVHWHPTTVELGYVIKGSARMSIMDPDGSVDTYVLKPGDMYAVPVGYPHQIEDLGGEEIHFGIFFSQSTVGDVGLKAVGTALSREMLASTLGVEGGVLPDLPFTPADPLIVQRVNPVDPVRVAK